MRTQRVEESRQLILGRELVPAVLRGRAGFLLGGVEVIVARDVAQATDAALGAGLLVGEEGLAFLLGGGGRAGAGLELGLEFRPKLVGLDAGGRDRKSVV